MEVQCENFMNRIRRDQEFEMMNFEFKSGSVGLQGSSTEWTHGGDELLNTFSAE